MFNGEENFKFYVYEDQVFYLETALLENEIEFHNELGISTNVRTNKYYIRNSDRIKFDTICKETKIDVFTDSIPTLETRIPVIGIKYFIVLIFIIIIILLLILLS